ncbi:MAG: hypothetical protein R6U04_12855 [Bacteroidales bacterium]
MAENNQNIQTQIDDINRKLDLVLEHVNQQRLKREMIDDLVADTSIITKDAWDSTVKELDNQGIELDIDDIKQLIFKFLKNIKNFTEVIAMFESINDLMKDASPIVNEVGVDMIHKLHEFEEKGYFEFLKEAGNITDKLITHISPEDLRKIADNIPYIADTLKKLSNTDMLKTMNNAADVYQQMDGEKVEEYSLWKTMRTMNSKEMKKTMGFLMTFIKKLNQENQQQKSTNQ